MMAQSPERRREDVVIREKPQLQIYCDFSPPDGGTTDELHCLTKLHQQRNDLWPGPKSAAVHFSIQFKKGCQMEQKWWTHKKLKISSCCTNLNI